MFHVDAKAIENQFVVDLPIGYRAFREMISKEQPPERVDDSKKIVLE